MRVFEAWRNAALFRVIMNDAGNALLFPNRNPRRRIPSAASGSILWRESTELAYLKSETTDASTLTPMRQSFKMTSRWGNSLVNKKRLVLITALAFGLLTASVVAQQIGESVSIDQPQASDQYLAGRSVRVTAPIDGDLVIVGQALVVDAEIAGDVIAAGQTFELRDSVADDVRAAGQTIALDAQIMGHAVAAGQELTLGPTASVENWAWFAGQSVIVEGRVGEELKAAGQRVVVSGEVGGDAVLAAEAIQIEPGAIIRGDLIWDSDEEPEIAANATVEGQIIEEDLAEAFDDMGPFEDSDGVFGAVLSALAVIAASFLAFLIFPVFSGSVADRIRSTPLRSIGLGVGVLVAIPIVVLLLFISRIGWIVALGMLFGFFVLVICAMVFGMVSVGEIGLELMKKDESDKRRLKLLAIALGVVFVLLLAQIPVLGTIAVLLVLISGLGAMTGELVQRYRRPA